jgi:hypothetical protein
MGATAAILAWTTATVPATFAAASSDKPQQTVRNGVKRYVGVATTTIASAPGGSAFATLYVSAAVVMTGTEAGTAHVTSRLWIYGDAAASGPLYTAPQGVEVGRIDAVGAVHAISGMTRNGWTLIEIEGCLPADAVVDSLEPVWRTAEFNYQFICADCHSPHAAKNYSSMQWCIIMSRMAKNAKLGSDEAMVILKWLQTTSFASDTRG